MQWPASQNIVFEKVELLFTFLAFQGEMTWAPWEQFALKGKKDNDKKPVIN